MTCHWILLKLTSGYAIGECDIHFSPLTWFDLLIVLTLAIASFGFHDSQLWRLAIQPFPFPEILCFLGCWWSDTWLTPTRQAFAHWATSQPCLCYNFSLTLIFFRVLSNIFPPFFYSVPSQGINFCAFITINEYMIRLSCFSIWMSKGTQISSMLKGLSPSFPLVSGIEVLLLAAPPVGEECKPHRWVSPSLFSISPHQPFPSVSRLFQLCFWCPFISRYCCDPALDITS